MLVIVITNIIKHKPKVTRDRNLEARLELVSQHLGGEEVGVGCWQVAIIPVTRVAAKVGC